MTSGACGPVLSLLALIASSSSAEPASGLSSLTVEAVLGLEALDDAAVVAPVVRQGDRGQRALGLGGVDQRLILREGGPRGRSGEHQAAEGGGGFQSVHLTPRCS